MFQQEIDEIQNIEKHSVLSNIVVLMQSFGISLEDISNEIAKTQDKDNIDENALILGHDRG